MTTESWHAPPYQGNEGKGMAEGEGQREGGCDCLSAKAYRSVGGHQLGHPVHGFGAVGEEVRVLRRRGRALRWRARHEKTS